MVKLGRCQCLLEKTIPCPNHSLTGRAFCKDHTNKCGYASPMTGYEPKYDPDLWNNKKERRETHNCYAYAMNVLDIKLIMDCLLSPTCNTGTPQPGYAAGYKAWDSTNPKTCPDMRHRILGDNPSIIGLPREDGFLMKCPEGTSKIALVVDPDEDYHFLRQDSDGWWSQKGGAKPVVKVDASDHPIWNPELADHNWTNEQGVLDYEVFCGFMCVPRRVTNTNLKLKISAGGRRRTKKHVPRGRAGRVVQAKRRHKSQTKRYQGRKA